MANKIVFECGGDNPFAGAKTKSLITLEQNSGVGKKFTVTYGLQREDKLSYSQACAKLGQAILHNACCEGLAENTGV
jgi:hypothetical protein